MGQQIFEKRKIVSSTEKLTHRWAYGNGIDEPLVMWRDTSNPLDETLDAVSYFNRNQLGNARIMTKWSGSAVVKEEQYEYKAFGAITIKDGSGGSLSASAIGNPFTFTGREFDAESGLYHYRARAMHPGLGRFMQKDPKRYVDSMNLYESVRSAPTGATDPLGTHSGPRFPSTCYIPVDICIELRVVGGPCPENLQLKIEANIWQWGNTPCPCPPERPIGPGCTIWPRVQFRDSCAGAPGSHFSIEVNCWAAITEDENNERQWDSNPPEDADIGSFQAGEPIWIGGSGGEPYPSTGHELFHNLNPSVA